MAGRERATAGGRHEMGAAGPGAGWMWPGGCVASRRRAQDGIHRRARRRIQIHREATGGGIRLLAWRC
jgi:hypothetical protein